MNMLVQRHLLILAVSLVRLVLSARVRVVHYDTAKEKALQQGLFTLRRAINQYALGKQKVPGSLEDLVKAGYLKSIPIDPFTSRGTERRAHDGSPGSPYSPRGMTHEAGRSITSNCLPLFIVQLHPSSGSNTIDPCR